MGSETYYPTNLSGKLPLSTGIPAFMLDGLDTAGAPKGRHGWLNRVKEKEMTPNSLSTKSWYRIIDKDGESNRVELLSTDELKKARAEHPNLRFYPAGAPFPPNKMSPLYESWYRNAKTKEEKVLLVDFDGTIAEDVGYPEIGEPIESVIESLHELMGMGYKVRVYTCRLNASRMKEGVEAYAEELTRLTAYMEENQIPYDDFVLADEGKPFGDFYIDDKSLSCDHNWDEIVSLISKDTKSTE